MMFGRKKATGVVEPSGLRERLERDRAVDSVRREDDLARKATVIDHEIREAGVRERKAAARWARVQRARNAREMARLSRTRQRAIISGTRARLTAEMNQSGEVRALRLARLQTAVLCMGIPALSAFGFWSMGGVQAGTAELFHLVPGSFLWVAAWFLEPALILVAAGIIIFKAILRACGGEPTRGVSAVEWVALSVSVALNWVSVPDGAGFGGFLLHSIGPVGAAGVAFAIGLLLKCIGLADPWKDAPRIADMDFTVPDLEDVLADPFASLAGLSGEVHRQVVTDSGEPVPVASGHGVGELPAVPSGEALRSNRDQGERSTVAVRRDRGRKVPAVAKKPARRASRSVAELAADLDEAIKAGRLTEDASVNQVRLVLECSPSRAKEAIAHRASEVHRPKLAVVGEQAVNE